MTHAPTLEDDARRRSSRPTGASRPVGLVIVASPVAAAVGRVVPLSKTPSVIERVAGAGLEDGWMSRLHTTAWLGDDGCVLVHDGAAVQGAVKRSANGTWLGGRSVDGEEPLVPGAVLRTGRTLWMAVEDPAPMPQGTVLVGTSAALGRARAELELVAAQVASRLAHGQRVTQALLVTGPRGTGKQVVALEARRLLSLLRQRQVPFLQVAAPALSDGTTAADLFGVVDGYATGVKARPGHFERAHGGVLLLDEVGDTPVAEQAKLLGALQEREVVPLGGRAPVRFDCLVVAATNRELGSLGGAGLLRDDLVDRLSRFVIDLPPLDSRKEDVPFIAADLLTRHGFAGEVAWEVVQALVERSYPGNVRELDVLVERMVAVAHMQGSDRLDLSVLQRAAEGLQARPASEAVPAPAASPQGVPRGGPPREELLRALVEAGWNKTEVGRRYGKHPRQIARWMGYAGIESPHDP